MYGRKVFGLIPSLSYNTFEDDTNYENSKSALSSKNCETVIEIFEAYNTENSFPVMHDGRHCRTSSIVGTENNSELENSPFSWRKCEFCPKIYREIDNNDQACRHHTGQFSDTSLRTSYGSVKRWSCCKNENASSEGCVITKHVECRRTSIILKSFKKTEEFNTNSSSSSRTSYSAPPSRNFQEPARIEGIVFGNSNVNKMDKEDSKCEENRVHHKPNSCFQHKVLKSDTLQGLALRYNVRIEDIRRANHLFSNDIFSRRIIEIPLPISSTVDTTFKLCPT